MNVRKLIQKQGFKGYEFLLLDDTISVKQVTITEKKEWVVKLDQLRYKTIIEKESSLIRDLVAIFLGLCSLLIVILNTADHSDHMNTWSKIALCTINFWLAITMFFTPAKNELRLFGGSETLVFLSDKPSEKEVREFVDEIILRSKNVLLRKYGADPDLPEQLMISQLSWLLDSDVINNDEFDVLKAIYYTCKA